MFPTAFPTSGPRTSIPPTSNLPTSTPKATETIGTGLPAPWGLTFLPDGAALVTLRDQAEVLRVAEGAKPVSVGHVPGVEPGGEGGLLGNAASPAFRADRNVFVHLTGHQDNRVMATTFEAPR